MELRTVAELAELEDAAELDELERDGAADRAVFGDFEIGCSSIGPAAGSSCSSCSHSSAEEISAAFRFLALGS